MIRPLSILFLTVVAVADTDATFLMTIGGAWMPEAVAPTTSTRILPALAAALTVRLPALRAAKAAQRLVQASETGPRLIGFGRSIPAHPALAPANVSAKPAWRMLADGRQVTAWRVESPGALGVRLGMRFLSLPDAAILRFIAPATGPVAVISGAMVNASVRRNRSAGVPNESAALYWSPLIEGESIITEVELPAAIQPGGVRFDLSRLSHFLRLPVSGGAPDPTAENDCHEDVMCHPGWDPPSRATAILLYTRPDGGSGICSGTLLDDADPATQIPYFLTAHHCVPDQARASSLETYWLYRSLACGGSVADAQAVAGGTDLLYTARPTDTSFLRLRRAPPAGVVFADWQTAPPAVGTVVAGAHHPQGQPQRIAVGVLSESLSCLAVEDCGADPDAMEEHFLRVTWSQGVTAGGGSGSGLFLGSGELVGTLFGGYSGCDHPNGQEDYYGRFDLAYRAALYRWLRAH
ncbi:hypothetical protein CCR95_04445 [Thiocystis minor]|uniref:trypsin-like peptidase domain-containing protein n=1 Tax=Thiocystis minor TaxID=61597 RepID=UPI001913F939|nr:trypsin-like peptidase domain-containing protein [Thiocystis minor]MBK5963357.1 hypothetical protein [Thiocystis minor]